MNKSNVISFKICDKTQAMMTDELNWCMRENTPAYAKWQAKDGDTVITLYESGKVVFQGKDADLASDFWIQTEKINNGKVDIKTSSNKSKESNNMYIDHKIYNSSSIGSDEVGTGDYFGPIVVTASYVSKENISYLEKLGVKDSKKMTDEKILEIVPQIIKRIPYESIILSNKQYNNNYNSDVNMNKIKAILHNKVLFKIKAKIPNYDYVIVDQFAQKYVYFNYLKNINNVVKDITFLTKGESKSLAVATSSLISRYIFIQEFNKISKNVGINIPKGASEQVDLVALAIAKEKGIKYLENIAKLNFKNTDRIVNMLEKNKNT